MNSSAAESFVVVETLDLRARSDDEPSESPRPALETPERKAPLEPSSLQKMWDNVYSPPRQRVGDVSIRTLEGFDETAEWEHIFLDLFYVPAISNLSEMLQAIFTHEQVDADNANRNLCFFAVFFSIWSTWYHNTVAVSKFVADSRFHRIMNKMRLLLVGTAIFHISEADEMMDVASVTSFYYCFGITMECALTIIARIELILQGTARMKKDSAVVLCFVYVPRMAFFTAALFRQGRNPDWHVLVLCGSLIPSVLAIAGEYFFTMVPIDQHKYNERIGAWVSVLLGEGVIGLLKSNTDRSDGDRWATVIIGLMTVMVVHAIYFFNQGSVRDSEKFKGWLQSGSIQALSVGVIGIGVFSANGPEFDLLSRHYRDFDIVLNVTEACTTFVSEDDGTASVDGSTKTIFPHSIIRSCNNAYFVSLALILLSLELVFWTANPTRIEKVKTWFGEVGIWNRALMCSMFFIQAFVIVSFPVLVNTTDMDELKSEDSASIGFATTLVFYIIRVYIIKTTDGRDEE